jgi:hypothetical protein
VWTVQMNVVVNECVVVSLLLVVVRAKEVETPE